MTGEAGGVGSSRMRRMVFPEEAITRVKVLEVIDPQDPGFYRVAIQDGREIWTSVPREERFEIGEDAEVLLTFSSGEFRVIPSGLDTSELGVWPESEREGRVPRYRFVGRIGGMYDWNVERGLWSRSVSVGLIVLIDVGFPLTFRFDFQTATDDKPYFGFSDFISGVGGFGIVAAGTMRNHVRIVKEPPWRMRSVEAQFMEDEFHQLPPLPVPSKAERREIRRKARSEEDGRP